MAKKTNKVKLQGLPGTKKHVMACRASSVTGAVRLIRDGKAATASGDNGALNVWKNDAGLWCCEFHRYWSVKDSKQFKYVAAVSEWLKLWWPLMGRD